MTRTSMADIFSSDIFLALGPSRNLARLVDEAAKGLSVMLDCIDAPLGLWDQQR